ncbi:SAF domain-containing protein [Rhodococcus sp. BP-349]|uniref:SAF domain-containing protein n=1 Tax=unclassified Rhodococcus (in: high G+C Gram-positive bacteria) TaxID=192944 RepID=UPI001C9B2661|nr:MULTISPECIES: SAF domain-containing protein [unclassified Rhodococcus (in: high G+C Gram-positive bacteria)]MBY6538345.1 SAF domain-containing protein [Rhodococcus sp. BP-363]MBY6542682.1 SAF domain-containing protein [Rhodococcus sp. BP-369]MBY6561912.1 SAF domain-containing protein [Rhodococcus sp. BP-370]MBY6576204.1 SAF domain-containing protein [Rhodococcus sp. BP-364]MBY6585505.1 SAF domain-containing protein [Rhodococcus sp. BP-358]
MSPTVDHPLSARLFDRIPPMPPRLRSPAARRILAGALVALAAVSAYRTDPSRTEVPVVVAAADLTPGTYLTAADVTLTRVDSSLLADGTLRSVDEAVGRTVAGPVRSGEALTDVRLLGPRLASATLPSGDARIVPIRLADPELAQLLRAGDVVDVVRAANSPDGDDASGVIAESATVVMVSAPSSGVSRREQLVLVALRADDASAVAAASLSDALTVLLR